MGIDGDTPARAAANSLAYAGRVTARTEHGHRCDLRDEGAVVDAAVALGVGDELVGVFDGQATNNPQNKVKAASV